MNKFTAILKKTIIQGLRRVGYQFVRIKDTPPNPIDVFPLIVRDYIHRKSSPAFFVVQIGANDGVLCDPINPLIREFGNWRGVLVEPNPEVFEILKKNYKDQPQLSFECAAIAGQDGTATFHCSMASEETSRLGSLDAGTAAVALSSTKHNLATVQVKTMTLSSLFAKHGIENFDLLQIDAEGHDYEIMVQLLTKTTVRPSIIQFEHSLMDQNQYSHCCQLLGEAGYAVLAVDIDTIALLHGKPGPRQAAGTKT